MELQPRVGVAFQPEPLCSPVAPGSRKSSPTCWRIEYTQRVRRFSFSVLPQVTNPSLRRRCPYGSTSKRKHMVCPTRKDAESRSRSIVTVLNLIQTQAIELSPMKD